MKIQIAQQKAAMIKKTRDEARAKGLSPEDEKAAVHGRPRQVRGGAGQPAAAAAQPRRPAMTKVELAQAKAKVITKARAEARAQGMSTEDEKMYVAEELKEFSAQLEAGAAAAPRRCAEARDVKDRAGAGQGQGHHKAREEARAQGMSTEDEKKYVAEKLKAFSAENQ